MKRLILFIFCSCATLQPRPTTPCITRCGIRANLDVESCQHLKDTEQKILLAYELKADFVDRDFTCLALDGFSLVVHERTYMDILACPLQGFYGQKGCVLGQTKPIAKVIEIETDDFEHSAFPHECGHIFDFWFGHPKTSKHCGWTERGIKDAIEYVTKRADENPESC